MLFPRRHLACLKLGNVQLLKIILKLIHFKNSFSFFSKLPYLQFQSMEEPPRLLLMKAPILWAFVPMVEG